jgi:hypothetical protein
MCPGKDGRLGDETTTPRLLGVRRVVGTQSTLDIGWRKDDKDEGTLGFDQGRRGEAGGVLA